MTWRSLALAALLVATLGACASPVLAPGTSQEASPQATPADRLHQQAHDALERWADAVRESGGASIAFTGQLTAAVGGFDTDGQKEAFAARRFESVTDLPTDRPSRGQVKWVDGKTTDVNVLSAAATFQSLVADAKDCPACAPLRVTAANLATALVETSLGPAEAPVWVFTVAASSTRITRVAVDKSITVTPPPWNANDPPVGISVASATGAAESKKLTVSFVGAPKDQGEPCGADYTAEAVESELAVVVLIAEHRNGATVACDAVGALRTAEVRLASKLGERTVLEVKQGLPVPVVAP